MQDMFLSSIVGRRLTYTLSELEAATGVQRRALQFWTSEGVIKAIAGTAQAGRGVHRRYSQDEAIIACAVLAFANQRLTVGELKEIAKAIRAAMKHPKSREGIEAAASGNARCYLVFERWGKGGWYAHVITGPMGGPGAVESLLRALASMPLHLNEPNSSASMILLNSYTAGLIT